MHRHPDSLTVDNPFIYLATCCSLPVPWSSHLELIATIHHHLMNCQSGRRCSDSDLEIGRRAAPKEFAKKSRFQLFTSIYSCSLSLLAFPKIDWPSPIITMLQFLVHTWKMNNLGTNYRSSIIPQRPVADGLSGERERGMARGPELEQ